MNVLDLFSGGCGGWSLGLERAGFHTVAACEIDPWRRERYSRNFPHVRVYDDVRTITAQRLYADGNWPIHIVAGSPPCQDASTANTSGKGAGGPRTGLVSEYVRLVREIRPYWALFENVPGLRTRGVDWILAALAAAGYPSWPLVVGAWHAGAPHKRNRVWGISTDATRIGCGSGRPWGLNPSDTPESEQSFYDADPASMQRFAFAGINQTEITRALLPTPKATDHKMGRARQPWSEVERENVTDTSESESIRRAEAGGGAGGRRRLPNGHIGTAALLILSEWMMGYPKDWLGLPWLPTATLSSRSSQKSSVERLKK